MLVNIHYVHNDRKYYIPEFSIIMNAVVRDNQPIIMFLPDPVNKRIKSDDYCLNYFWKVISVDFEIPTELKDYDFENEASFGLKGCNEKLGEIVYGDYIPYYMGTKIITLK